MTDDKERKTIDIDVDLDEGPIELGYQGKPGKSQDASAEELKQQAGELLKAAGGLAGSFGKYAVKKGSELKDKISDEEFQKKVKSSAKAYADKAGSAINSGVSKAEDTIKESKASVKAKAANKSQQRESAKAGSAVNSGASKAEDAIKESKASVKAKAAKKSQQRESAKAGSAINNGASKAEDAIKESKASVKAEAAKKSQQRESAKASATSQGDDKGNKKLGIILLAICIVVAGTIAVLSSGSDEQPAAEEPVAEENMEETTEEVTAPEEQTNDSEKEDEPATVYYSTNTEETVKDGNTGVYAYKNQGGSYDVYYIIDFDEGCVYSFTDGNGEDYCDKVKIDSGDLNDVVMVTYDFDGELAPYGFHFKYKNNPEHLIVQDNDGFELDFYPANLNDAMDIKEGKKITER